jgi:hypothetical protein
MKVSGSMTGAKPSDMKARKIRFHDQNRKNWNICQEL